MNYFFLVFSLLFLFRCSHLEEKTIIKKLEDDGYSIVIGCEIFNLQGEMLRSFPGDQCLFFEDGSFLSYDPKKQELSKFKSNLSKDWTLHRHIHHGMTRTIDNNILLKSSSFHNYNGKKNVRFDDLILINSSGEILGNFSFYETIQKFNQIKKRGPQKTNWDQNISFNYEATHLASAYELQYPIEKDGKVFAPKGSFLVSLNSLFSGAYIFNSDLSKLFGFIFLLRDNTFHDLQQYSSTELIYFLNNMNTFPESADQEAKIVIQNIYEKKISFEYLSGFDSTFGGSLQMISKDLIFISDSKSRFSNPLKNRKNSILESERVLVYSSKKGRVIFYSPKLGILHEIHFDKPFSSAKLLKTKDFLSRVISI